MEIITDRNVATLHIQKQLFNNTHGIYCCDLPDIGILLGLGQRPVQNNNLHLHPLRGISIADTKSKSKERWWRIIPYIHFTDDQKRRASEVDLEQFLLRQGEKLLPSGFEKRLASDHSVTIRGNHWYDHAEERGGGPVSFLRKFYGLTYPEAVTRLLDGEQGKAFEPVERNKHREKKEFSLPPASSNMRRMYAYLLKQRGISREVVDAFVHAKLIYESAEPSADGSKEYHNAVFIGCDEHGVARHAHKRGLYSFGEGFKRNVTGCDSRYSFLFCGTSDRLYVFEAPIDLLSFITLHPEEWQEHSYVALCGVSENALLWMLEQNSALRQVKLCLDNDRAGIEASQRISESLQERGCSQTEILLPSQKDWNKELTDGSVPGQQEIEMTM